VVSEERTAQYLPGTQVFLVRVRADQVEVEMVSVGPGKEIAAVEEVFQVEELVIFEEMNGFDIALEGMSAGGMRTCRLSARALGKTSGLTLEALVYTVSSPSALISATMR
jgi:hypothetical protein